MLYFIAFIVGDLFGVALMRLFQINWNETEREERTEQLKTGISKGGPSESA